MSTHPDESPRSEQGTAKPPTRSEPGERAFLPAHPEERLSTNEAESRRTEGTPKRIGWFEGHLPDVVEPLDPRHPDTAITETRRLRHDGWTPEKKKLFLERFAECGVVVEACQAAGMSARSAYNLHDRDPLFAAGWEAASVIARPRLAAEAFSRSMNGVVDRIYKDGVIVAERHRYDNRLTMSVLARLDSRIDRAEEKGAPHLALVARWDEYLAALEEDRREDGLALLAGLEAAPAVEVRENAGDRELRELHLAEEDMELDDIDEDPHDVWESQGCWWTDYPPPAGFDGEEHGEYGRLDYRRTLTPEEQAVVDAEEADEKAEARAKAEAQRAAYFGFDAAPAEAQGEGAPVPAPPLAEGESHAEGP